MATKPKAAPLRATPVRRQSANGDGDSPTAKIEMLAIPSTLLLAAETVASKAPKDKDELHGVMLHLKDTGIGRIVATDGDRYFIGSFAVKPIPSWLKGGILIGSDNLKARVNMVAKIGASHFVLIGHAKGTGTATMADERNTMRFDIKCAAVTQMWPYEDNIKVETFSDMDDEAEAKSRPEWKPVGFNSRHMKETGDIAKILESGIDKEKREPTGMVVRVYDQGNPDAPSIFMFDGVDGALLIVGALKLPARPLPLLSARVLEPATKGTLAALRAHETRWKDAAAAAASEEERTACLAKAESFNLRIAALLALAPERVAIAGPAAAAEKIEGPEGEDAGGEPEPQTAGEKSAATRQRKAAERAAKVLH
jgi:hypothetical protein